MKEEIFGPILPVIEYADFSEIKKIVQINKNPLALYCFTKSKSFINNINNEIPAGGVCINNTIIHIVNHRLPFGGRGSSGIGYYHGENSFDAFSHQKAVTSSSLKFDFKMKYPPYDHKHEKFKKYILK